MSVTYTDNQVPIGGRVLDIKYGPGSGSTRLASSVWEDINLTYVGAIVERKDEIGKENGFTVVDTLAGTGTGVVQIPLATSVRPHIGDWIQDVFDGSTTAKETWVITGFGQQFRADTYYKVNVNLKKSNTPPTS